MICTGLDLTDVAQKAPTKKKAVAFSQNKPSTPKRAGGGGGGGSSVRPTSHSLVPGTEADLYRVVFC